jgi:hypothetical protein
MSILIKQIANKEFTIIVMKHALEDNRWRKNYHIRNLLMHDNILFLVLGMQLLTIDFEGGQNKLRSSG